MTDTSDTDAVPAAGDGAAATVPAGGGGWRWGDLAGLLALYGMAAALLATSWRKWADPMVDFGHELYFPWQFAEGRLPGHDLEFIMGPLSQMAHGLLFRCLGPSLLWIIIANFVVVLLVTTGLYVLGHLQPVPHARWLGLLLGGMFLGISAFAQLRQVAAFSFMAPYRHEVTHGFLLLVAMLVIGQWALQRRRNWRWAGYVLGLLAAGCISLKPEILIAGVVLLGGWWLVMLAVEQGPWRGLALRLAGQLTAGLLAGLILVVLAAIALGYPPATALRLPLAHMAVLGGAGVTESTYAQILMGTDHVGRHMLRMLRSAGLLGFLWGLAAAVAWRHWTRPLLAVVPAAAGIGLLYYLSPATKMFDLWFGLPMVACLAAGLALPGLYRRLRRGQALAAPTANLLFIALPAGALMLKIALNVRIGHYGFVLTPLAFVVYVLLLVLALPARWPIFRPAVLMLGATALLGMTVTTVLRTSYAAYDQKTQVLGEGDDALWHDPRGYGYRQLGQVAYEHLKSVMPPGSTLVVLPEGTMLNYQLRAPDPTPYTVYNPFQINHYGGEAAVLATLQANPPDYIVYTKVDTSGYGYPYFGAPGYGDQIMAWIQATYPEPRAYEYRKTFEPTIPALIFARHGLPN